MLIIDITNVPHGFVQLKACHVTESVLPKSPVSPFFQHAVWRIYQIDFIISSYQHVHQNVLRGEGDVMKNWLLHTFS